MTGLEAKRSPKNAMTLDELFGTASDAVATEVAGADPDHGPAVPAGASQDGGMTAGVAGVSMDPRPPLEISEPSS